MTIDIENNTHIIASDGMVFKRISDGLIYGTEIFLGLTYFISGVKLVEPLQELPEHFEEVSEASTWAAPPVPEPIPEPEYTEFEEL